MTWNTVYNTWRWSAHRTSYHGPDDQHQAIWDAPRYSGGTRAWHRDFIGSIVFGDSEVETELKNHQLESLLQGAKSLPSTFCRLRLPYVSSTKFVFGVLVLFQSFPPPKNSWWQSNPKKIKVVSGRPTSRLENRKYPKDRLNIPTLLGGTSPNCNLHLG